MVTPSLTARISARKSGKVLSAIAKRLAETLPSGALVRVDWNHPELGRGYSTNFDGDAPSEHVIWRDWVGGEGATLNLLASHPQSWPDGVSDFWPLSAQRMVEAAVSRELAAHTIKALQRSELLQQALFEIGDLASSDLDLQDMLGKIHQIVGDLMYAENLYIVLYDDQRRTMRFLYFVDQQDPWVNDPNESISIDDDSVSLTKQLLTSGENLRGPTVKLRELYNVPYEGDNGPDSADWLGVPMRRDDRVAGAIVVQSYRKANVYTDDERILLAFVAQHILTALERRESRDELELRVAERTRELQHINQELQAEVVERKRMQNIQRALYRIAELSMANDSLQHFYGEVHEVISGLLYAKNFYIATLSDDGTMLDFAYSVDERDQDRTPRKLAAGLTEYVLQTGRPLLANRARIADLEERDLVKSHGAHAHCWLGVPLMHDDRVAGVLAVQSYSQDILFTERDQDLLTFVSFHIGSSLARKQAQERLMQAHANLEQRVDERTRELAETNAELVEQIGERMRVERKLMHQASHDALTGLPNRTQLLDRLSAAVNGAAGDPNACFAVLFLDLDRFKLVNDSVGHAVGDELLVESSRRIVASVRGGDVVARFGGDEFAILAEGLDGEDMACELAQRVLDALAAPVWIAGRELFPGASIGIALWNPRYRSGDELLRDADAAMYRAKGAGRHRCALFDEHMHKEAIRSLDLETDLRRALTAERFVPFYQPIVDIRSGDVMGCEALLRWQHEEHGILLPGEFLDIGEESGLIEQIDWMIYQRVVADLATRQMPPYVAINVSPRHFRVPDFANRLLGLLDAHGVPASRLRVEITEVALLDDAQETRDSLALLRNHGVLAQLDDFGTGYSALSYLHRFPIAGLKIDRSFIAGLDDDDRTDGEALVRAIVALAGSLSIELIAEGVETPRQRERLEALGCAYAQGFLLGRPQPLPERA